ncbi:MAG: transglutaminase family protein [Candidatus Aenigmatarchaeota archaeon]
MKKLFFLMAAFALAVAVLSSTGFAVTVNNPQNVEYMKAEVVQSGSVSVTGDVSELNVSLYIPQADSAQTVDIKGVSNPNYFFEKDRFGNGKINMFWKNPETAVNFTVKSLVTINRRNSANFYNLADFSKPTELIQSTDPEIESLAENLTLGKKTDFEKISSLTKWVNENIEYDLAYSDVNLSATTVLHHRKGVCDEFSTLLLSMARALGYQASYIVGYAYGKGYTFSEGDFAAHGWTEIYTTSGTIISDPTWGEIPVDASHIKFASLADSIYPEVNVSGIGKSPKLKINPTKTEINILEVRETPIIDSSSSLLDSDVWNGYAVVKTELSNPGCVLTKISSQPCVFNGGLLLQPEQNDSAVYFCGSKTFYSIFKLPESLDERKIYTCPIAISAYNANQNVLNLTLEKEPSGSVKLSLDKASAVGGETVTAESPGSYLFTSDGQSDFGKAEFKAGDSMTVYAYKGGALERQSVAVVKKKPFEISIEAGENYTINETGFAYIAIKNLLQESQNIALNFRNNSQQVYLAPLSEKTLNISFVPQTKDDNLLQAYASVSGFDSYTSKLVELREPPAAQNWWDGIIESITNFFNGIAEAIGKLFG